MKETSGFAMKNTLTLHSFGWKNFNVLGDESDEFLYTCKDKHRRWFLRQSIKIGKCSSFNQCYYSKTANTVFKGISE